MQEPSIQGLAQIINDLKISILELQSSEESKQTTLMLKSNDYDNLKNQFAWNWITVEQLSKYVDLGIISKDEFSEITYE